MTISPGWYKDPAEPTTQRYWDGGGWIGAPLPVDATPPEGPPPALAPPPPVPIGAPVGQPPPLTVPVRPQGMLLATPGARFTARMIDGVALLLLNILLNGWFVYLWLQESMPYSEAVMNALQNGDPIGDVARPIRMDVLLGVISLVAGLIWLFYEVPATARSGQTLGKRAVRIKVVRVEGEQRLGFWRSFRRWMPLGLSVVLANTCICLIVLPIIDLSFIPIDRTRRMALHDRSAGTYVVQLPDATVQKGQ